MKQLVPLLFLLTAVNSPAQTPTLTQFPIPSPFPSGMPPPFRLVAGPDGAFWFTNGFGVGRITAAGAVTYYPTSLWTEDIAAGPDGAMWFTEDHPGVAKVGRITTTGSITEFPLKTTMQPRGITTGPDGALWFVDASGTVGRITTSGAVTEFAIPVARFSFIRRIVAGADGALWIPDDGGKVFRMTPAGALTVHTVPGLPQLRDICVGPDGAIWFSGYDAKIFRIDNSGELSEYPIRPGNVPFGITAGPDGALWFLELEGQRGQTGRIARMTTAGAVTDTVLPGTYRFSITYGFTAGLAFAPDGAAWFVFNNPTIMRWGQPPATPQTLTRLNLSGILGFENGTPRAFPAGWSLSGGTADTITTDGTVRHIGNYSARIQRTASSSGTFSSLSVSIPMDFVGSTIQWRGWIRTEGVSGIAALWMRTDGAVPGITFSSLAQSLNLRGTTDWKQYTITLPAALPDAKQLILGFQLSGTGTAWVDSLELLVDGQPAAQVPARPVTALDTDHQFDGGSGITPGELSRVQIGNLATLAKVWGFLKYHHPAVTAGKYHWDYELFRVLRQVLAAGDSNSANAAMSDWIAKLGPVPPCSPCAVLNSTNLQLQPDLRWIYDQALLGPGLSQALQKVYLGRTLAPQFFVWLTPNVGNPLFQNELSYFGFKPPDAGFQLLALFRYWNMVQYFYPGRDVMAGDSSPSGDYWTGVLVDSIPRIALAPDNLTYQQEMMRFIARIHDTHANLWSSIAARPPLGTCQLPVVVRFVEGVPLITGYNSATAGPASGLEAGDVITQLDGVPVADLIARWEPLYAASNDAARFRDIGQFMTQGSCGPAGVAVLRGGATVNVTANRVAASTLDLDAGTTHDLPGPAFQMLSPDIAYLKLSAVKAADAATYVRSAAGTKALIIDIRNYPSDFVVFALGQFLVSQPVSFARFTVADTGNPGAFYWTAPLQISPQQPRYAGKVVILVDELTQSQAEYTAMAFRTAPGAVVIGSTTAGADGNVSTVPLPGGLRSAFSGLGVFYPDNRPTQRVGILPDILVKPTIAGLREGRDELIEAAIQPVLGTAGTPAITSILSASDAKAGPVPAGGRLMINGQHLGQPAASATGNATSLGGASVSICGAVALLASNSGAVFTTSPNWRLIAQVPESAAGQTECPVVVRVGSAASPPVTVPIAPEASPALGITTTSLADGLAGTAYSQTLAGVGGLPPYTWSVTAGSLPAGLSLSRSGTITGTPATADSACVTVQVSDALKAAVTQSYVLTVNSLADGGIEITNANFGAVPIACRANYAYSTAGGNCDTAGAPQQDFNSAPGFGWTLRTGLVNGNGLTAAGTAFNPPSNFTGFTQALFLQGPTGWASQSLSGLSPGAYHLRFRLGSRFGAPGFGTQTVQAMIDDDGIGTWSLGDATPFTVVNASFSVSTGGSHTLKFLGAGPGSGTAFLSDVSIYAVQKFPPAACSIPMN